MYEIYVDEAGISDREAYTNVVAVYGHEDAWKAADSHLSKLVATYVPEDLRKGFISHAKDFFNGKKYTERWPIPVQRYSFLQRVVAIPRLFGLDIHYAVVQRRKLPIEVRRALRNLAARPLQDSEIDHIFAYVNCLNAADSYIGANYPGAMPPKIFAGAVDRPAAFEAALDKLRGKRSVLPNLLRGNGNAPAIEIGLSENFGKVTFAQTADALRIQIADACAFSLRRYLNKEKHGHSLMANMVGHYPELSVFQQHPFITGYWANPQDKFAQSMAKIQTNANAEIMLRRNREISDEEFPPGW